MSFLFRVTFTGLCGFVPRQPEGAGTVLLVNSETVADDLNFHGNLHQHNPRIFVNDEVIDVRGKVLSYAVEGSATIEPSTLQIIDATFPLPLPTKPAPSTAQDRGAFWIANMDELEGGTVDDSCFSTPLPNKRVVARVKLTAGFLSTSRMIEAQNGTDIIWNFRKSREGTPALMRAMAGEFSVTALVNGESIRLDIFDPSIGQTVPRTLKPIAGEVFVQVENSCPRVDDGKQALQLEDFALFYRLSKARGALHLPYKTEGGDLTDTMCPPARFAPHTSA